MNETEMQKDSLTGAAAAAFAGVLLLAQVWRPSSGNNDLPFNISNPLPPDIALIAIAALVFFLSFVLATASIFTPLRCRLFHVTTLIRPLLSLFTLLAFVLSWLSLSSEVPDGIWWRGVLLWGSLGMFLFLFFRFWKACQKLLSSQWFGHKNRTCLSRRQGDRE